MTSTFEIELIRLRYVFTLNLNSDVDRWPKWISTQYITVQRVFVNTMTNNNNITRRRGFYMFMVLEKF